MWVCVQDDAGDDAGHVVSIHVVQLVHFLRGIALYKSYYYFIIIMIPITEATLLQLRSVSVKLGMDLTM